MEPRGRSRTPKRIRASASSSQSVGYATPRAMSRSRSRSASASQFGPSYMRTYQSGADVGRYRAAIRHVPRIHYEPKTFDAAGATTLLQLQADTGTAVADSANGFLQQGAAATASAVVLNQIPQGTTTTTRIGRFAQMKKIRLIGTVKAPITAAVCLVKMALVYIPVVDRSVTVMPPFNVIWGAQNPSQQRLIDNVQRFRVLKDWVWQLAGSSSTPSAGTEAFAFDDVIDLKLLDVSWTPTDTTGVFTDMEGGALCLYAMSNGVAGANTSAFISLSSRIYFKDA